MTRWFFLITSCFFMLTGCGGLSSEEKAILEQATDSLNKIAAATKIGVNYKDYNMLVIEAQAKTDKAMSKIDDSDIQENLKKVMETYADAQTIWSKHVSSKYLFASSEPIKTLVKKYSIPITEEKASDGTDLSQVNNDIALQIIWQKAKEYLKEL